MNVPDIVTLTPPEKDSAIPISLVRKKDACRKGLRINPGEIPSRTGGVGETHLIQSNLDNRDSVQRE
jgi:hypothetical protein